MIRLKAFLSILLLLFFLNPIQAQTWQKYRKSGNANLTDVVFVSKSRGFILGYQKVFMTTDTGKTWNQILSSYSDFSRIMFADANNGFIIGYNDLVLKTTDAGNNWSLIRTGNSDDDLLTLFPKDKDTIFVLGPDDIATNKFGNYLEYSYNGGSTWSRRSTGSTQTIRSMYAWNKNKAILGTLTGGMYQTNDGFANYTVNWNANNAIDTRVIKDSVVVIAALYGKIYRSSDYGNTWKTISTGTSENLFGLHFANDSIGMACGEKGVILYTDDGGLSWTKMTTNTTMTFWKVFVVNKYYAWAVGLSGSGDSTDIFKFGSEKFVSEKINHIKGSVIADVSKNCKKDSKENGPPEILIKAVPGPYYTYTLANGNYDLVLPDTGKFTVTAIIPYKYGGDKNQCDTVKSHTVQFKTFENTSSGKNFFFKADSTVKLEINIASSRKRRCAKNENTITFKNLGTKTVDSSIIQLFYSSLTDIVMADKPYKKSNGIVTFKVGKMLPGQGGVIHVIDSVLCNDPNVRGMTACMRVLITPQVMVENISWDSSWVKAKINCVQDSIAIIKLVNDGKKPMGDSASLDIFLDDLKVDTKRYKLAANDSLKFEMDPAGKLIYMETVLKKQHPYLEHLRVFKERCGDSAGFFSKQQVTKHALQEYPSFEDEVCIIIRDSYDPNDISVTPEGIGANHYIKNDNKLRYTIRFQNTGTDTAYNIYIIDTLPKELDIATLDMLGSSHNYTYKLLSGQKENVLQIDFKNIYLVDSFANEPLSNGFVSFDIRLNDSLKKGTIVRNFADIYFDFNAPVRTNTVFNTIYDTTFTQNDTNAVKPCMSSFIKVPRDTVICDKYEFEVPFIVKGPNKPTWEVNDFLTNLYRLNDTVAQVKTVHEGKFIITFELKSCENIWYDTATTFFWKNPTIKVKDSLYCGAVNDDIYFNCFACSYLWNGTDVTYNFKPDKPGKYWVKVTNICKSISDTFNLSYLPYENLDLGNDTILCDNATLQLRSDLKQGKFLWDDLDTNSYKTIDKAGKYKLQFVNKCNNISDSINVDYKRSPQIELGNDSIYCLSVNHPISLDSIKNEFNILWWDGSSASNKTLNDTGIYFVTLNNYCGKASDTLKMGVLNIPKLDLGKDSIYCQPISRTLTLNPAVPVYQINWWDGSQDISKTLVNEGVYYVSIANRCGSVTDTLKLSRAYMPDFALGKDTTYCSNFSRILNASSIGAKYLWSTGDTSRTIIVNKAGTYSVKASTYCGSLSRTLVLDQKSAPVLNLGKDTIIEKPFSFVLDASNVGSNYLWSDNSTTQQLLVDDHGKYWVRVTNICGSISDTIEFIKPIVVQIDPHLKVYPNPVTENKLTVSIHPGKYDLELIDSYGRLVWKQSEISGVKNLDMSYYSQGTYFLRIYRETGGFEIFKILKF